MKSATTVRRVVLSIIGVFITVAVVAGAISVQAAAAKPWHHRPDLPGQPIHHAWHDGPLHSVLDLHRRLHGARGPQRNWTSQRFYG